MWTALKQLNDEGLIAFVHACPVDLVNDDYELSANHLLSPECPCHPLLDDDGVHVTVVIHCDPDHPGAMTPIELDEYLKTHRIPSEASHGYTDTTFS
jgi:hypothetical protein